jgi:catalase-peroxidase
VWGNDYFNNLLDFKWVLTTSPAGKPQWKPSNPTNAVEAKYLMLTSDIALLHDPLESYQKIVQLFAHDLNLFNSVFAHAWYKLVTRDMGPISRCVGPLIPPAQSFQNPLPPAPAPSALPSWPIVRTAVRVAMKTASAAIEPDLVNGQPYYGAMFVHLAYACAATFRRTDYLGGCNGARIRFSPQKDWSVNTGLQSVLEVLAPIKQQFDAGLTWADLIVFAAQVAIEDASGLSLLFCAGRSDAIDGDGSAFLTAPVSLNYSATITQIEQQLLLSGLSWNDTVALQARPRSPTLMAKMGFKGTYTADPSVLNNQYFDTLLLGWASGNWTEVHTPQREFQLQPQAVYATPSDLDVINDQNLQPIAMALASDNQLFLQSFAAAWTKLVSLDRFNGPSGNLCPAYVAPLPVCLFGDCTTNPTGCVSGTTCIRQSAYFSQCQDSATANGKNCVALLQYGCAAQACCNAAASCQKGICILPTNCK